MGFPPVVSARLGKAASALLRLPRSKARAAGKAKHSPAPGKAAQTENQITSANTHNLLLFCAQLHMVLC